MQSKICNYDLYGDLNDPNPLPTQFSTILVSSPISYAKSSNPSGYPGDILYKNENNGVCDDNDLANCYHNTDALKYVVYYPKPYDTSNPTGYKYSQCPLPIYINVHGGGFSDCRDNDENAGDNVLCTEMAKRGFVVFNVNIV